MRRTDGDNSNRLWTCRKRIGLGQKAVAKLLGHKTTSIISEYERGHMLPNLRTAFKLAAIYRVPPQELYPDLYSKTVNDIEAERKCLPHRYDDYFHKPSSAAQNPGGRSWDALFGAGSS